jgi:hypothetical protein
MSKDLEGLNRAFEVTPYTPVEGTKSGEITAKRKAHDALYERLSHELIGGIYNLEAFHDWVDEVQAEAISLEEQVRYDKKADFVPEQDGIPRTIYELTKRRINPQYALDRAVVRHTQREVRRVQRKIVKKKGDDYHLSMNELYAKYTKPLVNAEQEELGFSTPPDQMPQGLRGKMEIRSRALTTVSINLSRMRTRLLPNGPHI